MKIIIKAYHTLYKQSDTNNINIYMFDKGLSITEEFFENNIKPKLPNNHAILEINSNEVTFHNSVSNSLKEQIEIYLKNNLVLWSTIHYFSDPNIR